MTYLKWWIKTLKEFPHRNLPRSQQALTIILEAVLVVALLTALGDIQVNHSLAGVIVFAVILGIIYISVYQQEKPQ